MNKMKPIETEYNGHRFRSRLEARWAVFFDALGVRYEYEPEGFVLPSGERYLPDFRVKCHGTRGDCADEPLFDLYIEVKGNMTHEDASRILEFAGSPFNEKGEYDERLESEMMPTLVVGAIPPKGHSTDSDATGSYDGMDGTGVYPFNYELIDGDHFAAYPAADIHGRFYLFGDDSSYIDVGDEEYVERAYEAARKARFEFGETPKVSRVNSVW